MDTSLREIIALLKEHRSELVLQDKETGLLDLSINKMIDIRSKITDSWIELVFKEMVCNANEKVRFNAGGTEYVLAVEVYNGNNFPQFEDKTFNKIKN